MLRLRVLPIVLILLGAGCKGEPALEELSEVEYYEPRVEPDWSHIEPSGYEGAGYPDAPAIPVQEVFRIGVTYGPEELQFNGIGRVAIDRDGSLYVHLRQGEIRVFSSEGTYLHTVGRFGEGPGELSNSIGGMFLLGDTLVVSDTGLGRITFFSHDGDVLKTMRVEASERMIAMAHGGGVFSRNVFSPPRPKSVTQDATRIYWRTFETDVVSDVSGQGDPRVTIADVLRAPTYWNDSGSRGAPIRWGVGGDYDLDGQGSVYVHSGAPPYRIDVYDWQGKPLRRIERPHTAVPVIHEAARRPEGYVDSIQASVPVSGEVLAALGEMAVSPDGAVLVNRPDLVKDPLNPDCQSVPSPWWDLFDPMGRFVGTLELPPCFGVRVHLENEIFGVARDELGVEQIVMFRWEMP